MDYFVAGSVEWEYAEAGDRPGQVILHGPRDEHGTNRRAWGPFKDEEQARVLRDALHGLPGFTDLSVIQGRLRGGDNRIVLRAA